MGRSSSKFTTGRNFQLPFPSPARKSTFTSTPSRSRHRPARPSVYSHGFPRTATRSAQRTAPPCARVRARNTASGTPASPRGFAKRIISAANATRRRARRRAPWPVARAGTVSRISSRERTTITTCCPSASSAYRSTSETTATGPPRTFPSGRCIKPPRATSTRSSPRTRIPPPRVTGARSPTLTA